MALQEQIHDFNRTKAEQHARILRCEEEPPQCKCGMPSTHAAMTPAGYHAYRCEDHARHTCWGSDCCGGQMRYKPLPYPDGLDYKLRPTEWEIPR